MGDFHRAAAGSDTVAEWVRKLDGHPNDLQRMLAKVFGVKGSSAALELFNQANNCVPGSWRHTFRVVVEMAGSLQPKNASQGILISQLIGVHAQAMEAMRRCRITTDPQLQELYSNRSMRLMRLFTQQLELLSRLQGTIASQKIVVEKVHVHSGGQAIVGAVETVDRGVGDDMKIEVQPHARRKLCSRGLFGKRLPRRRSIEMLQMRGQDAPRR
jgi:hypothetical protein